MNYSLPCRPDASAAKPPIRFARFVKAMTLLRRAMANVFGLGNVPEFASAPVLTTAAIPEVASRDASMASSGARPYNGGSLLFWCEQPSRLAGDSSPQWVAMLGGMLELGGTGVVIQLSGQVRDFAYHVYDPEGRRLGAAMHLVAAKYIGEQCARDRAEFGTVQFGQEADFAKSLGQLFSKLRRPGHGSD